MEAKCPEVSLHYSINVTNVFLRILEVRPLYAGASTTVQSPSNEQSVSNVQGTFFTEVKSELQLQSPTHQA